MIESCITIVIISAMISFLFNKKLDNEKIRDNSIESKIKELDLRVSSLSLRR